MGFTHPEFKRLLPKALRSENFTVTTVGDKLKVAHNLEGGKSIQIDVSAVMIRQITPLVGVSNVDVVFTFSGYSQAEYEEKIHLIRRGFQKGGG